MQCNLFFCDVLAPESSLLISLCVPDQICPSLSAVQDEIVNIHNTFRREVVPTASNMLKMVRCTFRS